MSTDKKSFIIYGIRSNEEGFKILDFLHASPRNPFYRLRLMNYFVEIQKGAVSNNMGVFDGIYCILKLKDWKVAWWCTKNYFLKYLLWKLYRFDLVISANKFLKIYGKEKDNIKFFSHFWY